MTAVVGGGAGPVHALALAERLGIDTVIVPRFAGALCAFGASVAPVRHDAGASYLSRWQDLHPESLSERLAGLVAEGVDDLVRAGAPPADVDVRCRLAVRYVGQIHEIPVDVPPEVGVEELRAAAERFHAAHRRLFGYADEAAAIELIDLDVVVTAQQASRLREDERTPDAGSGPHGVRSAWFDGIQDVPVYIGDRLARGFQAAGPALIDEETTTIVVRPGWTVALDGHAYRLERRAV
jgi:N-methylhydantoinase A